MDRRRRILFRPKTVKNLALYGGTPIREKPYPSWPAAEQLERDQLAEVLSSQEWGGHGKTVARFEALFAGMHDCKYGIATATGTLALELALTAAGVGEGDEVIVPAHSFIATATAVSRVRAVPVFVDIEHSSYGIDSEKMELAITDCTRAAIVVHFGGLPVDMDRIGKIARDHKLVIIEDAAHAHGAEWHGQRVGSFGLCAAFSFQNSKTMTAGEGGILTTNSEELAIRARSLNDGGRRETKGWFDHFELGSNFRMTAIQAALLSAQLQRLARRIHLREENVAILRDAVRTPGISFQVQPDAVTAHSFYLLVGRVNEKNFGVDRDEFVKAMEAEGIPCRPFYPHALYQNPLYTDPESPPHRVEPCPEAELATKDSFWIPHRALAGNSEDTLDISRAISKVYEAFQPEKPKGKTPIN
jgi:dTDP-4-amino-4,6-dideoxygalactose transaminase